MGLFDDAADSIENAIEDAVGVDTSVEHPKVGFDPEICEGCPYRGDAPLYRCGLCGCPTLSGFPMDRKGAPPASCPRLSEHEAASR